MNEQVTKIIKYFIIGLSTVKRKTERKKERKKEEEEEEEEEEDMSVKTKELHSPHQSEEDPEPTR